MQLTLKKVSPILSKSLDMASSSLERCFMPATEDDVEDILKLRKVLFKYECLWDDNKYIRWRFDFSDPGNYKKNHIWVFKYNEEILGIVGATHINLQINGKHQSAHHATDILVRSDYNGSGLGGWLALALTEKMPVLISTGANDDSRSMMARLYHPVPRWQVWKLPIRFSVLLSKKWPGIPAYLSNMIAAPFDFLLTLRRKRKGVNRPEGFNTKVLEQIPSEIDKFESSNKDIHVERNETYLNWRYVENPRVDFTILGMYIEDVLIGIGVSRMYTPIQARHKHACIFEWIGSNEKYSTLVLDATTEYLVSKGVKLIHANAYGKKARHDFSSLGFIERKEEDCIYVISSDKNIQHQLSEANDWMLTAGDSDSDLL